MKIAFLVPTLFAGGAERVAVTLCNQWTGPSDEGRQDVHLLTYASVDAPSAYPLGPAVSLEPLGLLSPSAPAAAWANNATRVRHVARRLRALRPDILLCFMTEANVVGALAARLAGVPVVISERTDPAKHRVPWLHRLARRLVYPRADSLTVQSEMVAEWYRDRMGLEASVVPNPIDMATFAPPAPGTPRAKRIVAVGRLDPAKAFDVLIEAFAALSDLCEDWTLTIFGEGPERATLEALIAKRGLGARVFLPGPSAQIPQEMKEAQIFVSASRYEGFPNALIEALASGLCVISTRVNPLVERLLGEGERGLLTPLDDVKALRATLVEAIVNEERRAALQVSAPQAAAPYEAGRVAQQWLDHFKRVLERR